MVIGFTVDAEKVDEGNRSHTIEISSNIKSERDHRITVNLLMSRSNATVSGIESDPNIDASITNLVQNRITELEFKAGARVLNISAMVKDDNAPEGTECFILRISPDDSYRHDFTCKKDSNDYYCEYMFCIDDGGDGEFHCFNPLLLEVEFLPLLQKTPAVLSSQPLKLV